VSKEKIEKKVKNLVIGCSDERLKDANDKFCQNLNPEITYFKEGGLLYSVPNFSKMQSVKFFQENLDSNDKVRIWALVHEDCQFVKKYKNFIAEKWLKGEAKKENILFNEISKYCFLTNKTDEVWYNSELEKIDGLKNEPDKFNRIRKKYYEIWQRDEMQLLDEIGNILIHKIEKIFSRAPLKDMKISPQIHIIYQIRLNGVWDNYFSITQFQTIEKMSCETIKV